MQKKTKKAGSESSKTFEERYAILNDGQKRAVDTIEGPVMVVAGPGTGKTEVVALRVANILRKTHARPSNILCLTFSVSGATAMRERLRNLIGPDAYGVTVRNFHGFCSDLIAENPLVFDTWSALEPISDIERYRSVNKIIDQMMPDCILVNRKQPYLKTKDLIGRISELKREGVTDREQLLKISDQYEQMMAGKSKEGTKIHGKNLLAARKFKELLELFFRYQQMLTESRRYDYEDMILYAVRALEEEDWLLSGLQEKYQYILVDEFQDTNGAQYRLVELLSQPRTPEDNPNLFVVGDDDQAIYRFQGANLANILQFHARFPKAPVIPLTVSYRCTQPILDAAESLIKNNSERLVGRIEGLDKHLISGAKEKNGHEPQLLFSPSDSTEHWMVAELVEERMKEVPPEEIAILCQTNAEVLGLHEVLMARDIPVEVKGKADLLVHPFVKQAIAILRGVEHPQSDGALAGAISCSCFGCHPADLGRLYARTREEKRGLMDILLSLDDPAVQDKLPYLVGRDALSKARDVLLDLHNKLLSRTVVETLEHLIKNSGLLVLARGGKDGKSFDARSFAALQEFFDRLKNRAYEQQNFSFEGFLDDLSLYEDANYSDIRLSYSLPHLTEKGVALMTAHQSKGMEFDVVILPNFREGHWDKRRNPSSLSMPEDLLFGWEKEQKSYERNQDERRLAYVAMTRARRELFFTCPKELTTGDKARSVSPSGFFAEAGKLQEQVRDLKDPEQAMLLLHTPAPDFDEEMKAFLKERLENYSLSVTALNHFLEDPKLFLELDLLQTPQTKESSLVYGNAVHDALRKWGLSVMEGKPMDEAAFLNAFRKYLDEREILTEPERKRLTKVGEEALPRFFDQRFSGKIPFVHKVEYSVSTHLDDVPLKGKIDRIDLIQPDASDVVIIDYKTGRPKSENEIRTDGDYFRQLVFYALLLEERGALLTPREFVLDFIGEGSEHPVQRSFVISEAEIVALKKVVKAVWAKVLALDFSPLD